MVRGPDCGWCGRELDGLRENIIRTDVGQLLFDHLFVVEKGGDINVFGRYESGYALVSLCEQGLSRAKKIEKLLFEYNKESGATLFIITHDEELAAKCDVQIRIKDGEIEDIKGVKNA